MILLIYNIKRTRLISGTDNYHFVAEKLSGIKINFKKNPEILSPQGSGHSTSTDAVRFSTHHNGFVMESFVSESLSTTLIFSLAIP